MDWVNRMKVDFADYTNWPEEWSQAAAGRTLAYDSDGDCWSDWSTGTVNTDCDTELEYANIWTNPNFNDNSNYTAQVKKYILAHELGHVCGLGHPSSSTQSVMHTGVLPTWPSYENPKSHADNRDVYSSVAFEDGLFKIDINKKVMSLTETAQVNQPGRLHHSVLSGCTPG